MTIADNTGTNRKKHLVHFEPHGLEGPVDEGLTILDAAREMGIVLSAVCGGKGFCGSCRVEISEGLQNLSAPDENETKALGDASGPAHRLACRAIIKGPISVSIPEETLTEAVILTRGDERPVTPDPFIRKYNLRMKPQDLVEITGDGRRLTEKMGEAHGLEGLQVTDTVLENLPETPEEPSPHVSVIVRDQREIIDLIPGNVDHCFGVAVDIGTTTVVGYLMDLLTGKQVSVGATTNPQVVYGGDVISRIAYAMEGDENRRKMIRCIRDCLNHILSGLCKQAGISRDHIYEMTIAGNTTMHHFFLDLDLTRLARAPFTPALYQACNLGAEELNLHINPRANVHVLPVIDGFVGADTVAVLISTHPHRSRKKTAVIDIGTNGEIVIGNSTMGLKCCSTAAGPAFEGGHIRFGMRAAQGAIEHVRIDPGTCDVGYRTIGGTPPRGICGSGIMDAVAQMIQCGLVQKNGRINMETETPRLLTNSNGPAFVLEWGEKTAIGRDIIIGQDDIREVQLAKAALYAGARILMKHQGVKSLERIVLAGAFGNYIDKASALTLGIFPTGNTEDIVTVGNAAGQGARLALLNRAKREEAAQISRAVEHIELNSDPDFVETFIEATNFP